MSEVSIMNKTIKLDLNLFQLALLLKGMESLSHAEQLLNEIGWLKALLKQKENTLNNTLMDRRSLGY